MLGLYALATPVASPAGPPAAAEAWSDYRAIMWQAQKPESCEAIRDAGIDSVALIPEDREHPARGIARRIGPLLECGLAWYVENIVTDFYSAYHRWSGERPVNWRFIEKRNAYQRNPADLRALFREPSLSDPAWHKRVEDRLVETVRVHRAHRPLFYSLGDEPGIADLSVAWDFDFSPASLEGMRSWLKARYYRLSALNAQWGSSFTEWNAVMPAATREAMQRKDGNFSAWADFKEWMDLEFAGALRRGTLAVHSADPGAYAAIEGAQVPGWGGYDYSRLATAVDLMELYDGGGNVEIVRSLNSDLVLLRTSFGGARERHDLWRSLLRGTRGVIFWDPRHEIVREGGGLGARGRAIAPLLREFKSGLGALLIHSARQVAPVAILYSPASMRTQWILDWQPKGNAWLERDLKSAYEDESAVRTSLKGFLDFLGHVGLEASVVVREGIEKGALRDGTRVLVLPRALALSEREAREIRRFVAEGGTLIADGEPGQFDEHSRRLAEPGLSDLLREAPDFSRSRFRFGRGRAFLAEAPLHTGSREGAPLRRDRVEKLMRILSEAGVEPAFTLTRSDGARALDVETNVWRNGDTTVVALQREAGGKRAAPYRLDFREAARLYDVRTRALRASAKSVELTLDPVTPTLIALSKDAAPALSISGPRRNMEGEVAEIRIGQSRKMAGTTVLRVELIDPRGAVIRERSRNVLARDGEARVRIGFTHGDLAGRWRVRATDVLTGSTAVTELELMSRESLRSGAHRDRP